MDATDAEYNKMGVVLGKVYFANTAFSLVSTGCQLFMGLYAFASLFSHSAEIRRLRWPYVAVSLTVCLFSSIIVSMDGADIFRLVFESQGSGLTLLDLDAEWSSMVWTNYVAASLLLSSMALVDGLLLVRCYIIYSQSWGVCAAPGLVYLASIGLGISYPVLLYQENAAYTYLVTAWMLTQVAFNILVTAIIGLRLFRVNRKMRAVPGNNSKIYSGIATMLVESALPPAIFGITAAVITLLPASAFKTFDSLLTFTVVQEISSTLYLELAVLSPLIIIFRVSMATGQATVQSGSTHTTGIRRVSGAPIASTISPMTFAHGRAKRSIVRSGLDVTSSGHASFAGSGGESTVGSVRSEFYYIRPDELEKGVASS